MSLFTSTSNRRRWIYTKKQNPRQMAGVRLIQRARRSQSDLLIPRTVAIGVLDACRQAHYIEQLEERLSRQLFNVGHLRHVPITTSDQQCSCDRRYACGIGNTLAVGFHKRVLVVGDVVDKQLGRLAVLDAFDQIADAGLAAVARRQRGWVRQYGLDHFQWHNFEAFGGFYRLLGEQAEVFQHGKHIDVVLTEAHPEAHIGYIQVLGQGMHFVMPGQVQILLADHWQVVGAFDFKHCVAGPLAVLPAPDLPGAFTEIDFRVEIGGEVLAVGTGVDVEDVDRLDAVEVLLLRQCGIGIDYARVETDAEDGGHALILAFGQVLPLVVTVPRRCFADLARLFVDGGVEVGGAGIDAGAQHRHIEEGRAHVDNDLRFGFANQRFGCFNIQRIQGIGLNFGRLLQAAFGLYAVDDGLAFGDVARRDSNTTEFVVVLRALVGHHLGDTSCTNDQNILLQLFHLLGTALLRQFLRIYKPRVDDAVFIHLRDCRAVDEKGVVHPTSFTTGWRGSHQSQIREPPRHCRRVA